MPVPDYTRRTSREDFSSFSRSSTSRFSYIGRDGLTKGSSSTLPPRIPPTTTTSSSSSSYEYRKYGESSGGGSSGTFTSRFLPPSRDYSASSYRSSVSPIRATASSIRRQLESSAPCIAQRIKAIELGESSSGGGGGGGIEAELPSRVARLRSRTVGLGASGSSSSAYSSRSRERGLGTATRRTSTTTIEVSGCDKDAGAGEEAAVGGGGAPLRNGNDSHDGIGAGAGATKDLNGNIVEDDPSDAPVPSNVNGRVGMGSRGKVFHHTIQVEEVDRAASSSPDPIYTISSRPSADGPKLECHRALSNGVSADFNLRLHRERRSTKEEEEGGGGGGGAEEEDASGAPTTYSSDMGPHNSKYYNHVGRGAEGGWATRGHSSDDNESDVSPKLGKGSKSKDTGSGGQEKAGLVGLRNIGNTCFMNTVLQCLSNTKPLLEYVLRDNYERDINRQSSGMKGALIRAFGELLHELWRESRVVDTSAFKDQIQRFAPRFMGYNQQDAQEFLRYLLEGLHEDVNRVTVKPTPIHTDIDDSFSDNEKAAESWRRYLRYESSKIVDLFVGQFKSTLKCTVCGHCSVTFDPFWDLSLPIPSKSSTIRLSQCFELFTKEEVLDGDEKPTCAKCGVRRKCTKSLSIQKFPKILVIHLKRFSLAERFRGKMSTLVEYPLNSLDLSGFSAVGSGSKGDAIPTYNLYGVANHSGSTYSGHYIAYCKHPYSDEWHCYNDSRVSSISTHSVVSAEGYVLFYEQTGQAS